MTVKFRGRQISVEAVQFTGKNLPEIEDFTEVDWSFSEGGSWVEDKSGLTLHKGDWLFRNVGDVVADYYVVPDALVGTRFEPVPDLVIPWTDTSDLSTNIKGYSYDGPSLTLTVGFTGGSKYVYHNVDLKTVQALQAADSKGTFFHTKIKDFYRWEKLTETKNA